MGKQVNFYMTEGDERQFVEFVRSTGNVGIFGYRMETPTIPLLDELPPMGTPYWHSLWLWDRENSPPPKLDYIPEQKYYVVDGLVSEVIEYDRCTWDEGRLARGRIYAQMAYWADATSSRPHLVRKNGPFQKWYGRLASWIKRHSTRDADGNYRMPGAAEVARSGGRLVQAVFAGGSAVPATDNDEKTENGTKRKTGQVQ